MGWNSGSIKQQDAKPFYVAPALSAATVFTLSVPIIRRWYLRRSIAHGAFLYPLALSLGLVAGKVVYQCQPYSEKVKLAISNAYEGLLQDMVA